MHKKELKINDKVYCIKNVYREYDEKLIFIKYKTYTVHNIKYATPSMYNDSKSDEVIITINYDAELHYSFWLKTDRKENLFSEYFGDMIEIRKIKIQKLQNEGID